MFDGPMKFSDDRQPYKKPINQTSAVHSSYVEERFRKSAVKELVYLLGKQSPAKTNVFTHCDIGI